jgi:hypothetical protein
VERKVFSKSRRFCVFFFSEAKKKEVRQRRLARFSLLNICLSAFFLAKRPLLNIFKREGSVKLSLTEERRDVVFFFSFAKKKRLRWIEIVPISIMGKRRDYVPPFNVVQFFFFSEEVRSDKVASNFSHKKNRLNLVLFFWAKLKKSEEKKGLCCFFFSKAFFF